MIDGSIAREGLDAPEHEHEEGPVAAVPETTELDLARAGVGTILWATGFRPDYSWVDLPLADAHGWPTQIRGSHGIRGSTSSG